MAKHIKIKTIVNCIDYTSIMEQIYKQLESGIYKPIVCKFEDESFQGIYRQISEPDESVEENKPKATKN